MILCTLLYGDYPSLARNVLSVLASAGCSVQVGLNSVSEETRGVVREITGVDVPVDLDGSTGWCGRFQVFQAGRENICKYPMQSRMFAGVRDPVLWLDDDVVFPKTDPLRFFRLHGAAFASGADYTGEPYLSMLRGNQLKWAMSRPWWRGAAPARGIVRFFRGGITGYSPRLLETLGWPDPCLRHNGGDLMLGLAFAQFPFLRQTPVPANRTGLFFPPERRGVSDPSIGIDFK